MQYARPVLNRRIVEAVTSYPVVSLLVLMAVHESYMERIAAVAARR